MIDNFIQKFIGEIQEKVDQKEYFVAGQKLMELGRIGIVIENKLIVAICTELADVLRNSLYEIDLYLKNNENKETEFKKTINKIKSLISHVNDYDEDLSDKEKLEIMDLMVEVIFDAEKIQYISRDLEMRKGRIRRERLIL